MGNPKIQILAEDVINKIAAGEVVERPASVVKELVENSIDAGAKNINVRISKGGKFLIIVEDDGHGMSKSDALLSIQRHATSKLKNVNDFNFLSTFGFRGEALSSIASVSKFRLSTCDNARALRGIEIVIEGGNVVETKECERSQGTTIIIENLFYNVPARRKFLKSDETEESHVVSLIKALALAETDISFKLYRDREEVFLSPIGKGYGDRANEIFGHNEEFIEVSYDSAAMQLRGAICSPDFGNVSPNRVVLFVNNRLAKNDFITSALFDQLRQIFPKHRGILAYLLFTIDPALVDVNVHPTKKEVRFKNEMSVKGFIAEAMRIVFKKYYTVVVPGKAEEANPLSYAFSKIQYPYVYKKSDIRGVVATPINSNFISKPKLTIFSSSQKDLAFESALENKSMVSDWKFIGSIFDNIVLFESKTGLVFLNTKSAVSRIVYENVTKQSRMATTQRLLIPIEISLSAKEFENFEFYLPVLLRKGFSVYKSAINSFKIDIIPDWLSSQDAELALLELASGKSEITKNNIAEECVARCIAKHVCGEKKYQAEKECRSLLESLFICGTYTTCPFGKAIYFELPKYKILRLLSERD